MGKAYSYGEMDLLIMDNFNKIEFKVMEFILGVISEYIKDNGNKIKWMDMANLIGLMDILILANIRMILNKELAN